MIAIIPARYASTRLPGKMLADLVGKPLIVRTMESAGKAHTVARVIVATDDERIATVVRNVGGEAIMTSPDHTSGSDRIAEVAESLPEGSVIVNVQGDEPLIAAETIDRAVRALIDDPNADIATVGEPMSDVGCELLNFNVVKIVVGEHGNALYFSRSPMPFPRVAAQRHDGDPNRALEAEPELWRMYRKHCGIYVYRREYLLEFAKMPPTRLEQFEMLEQLRALENGAVIKVVDAAAPSIGVDTPEDLERVRAILMLPDVTIREATVGDVPRVAKVHVESWQRSFAGIAPEDHLNSMSIDRRIDRLSARFQESGYCMLVAEHTDGTIAGFVDFGKPVLDVDQDTQIFSFYLLPQFQRLGLGAKLFKTAVGQIRTNGGSSLCLDSLEMSPYRRFYEKYGGSATGGASHRMGDEEFATVIYSWGDLDGI